MFFKYFLPRVEAGGGRMGEKEVGEGSGGKTPEKAEREICEKTLKNRHFRKKKRRKKRVLGVVFLLRLYYNVVSSGEKWLKRE